MPAGTAGHVGDVGCREAELAVPSAPGLTAGGSGLLPREAPFVDGRVLQGGEDVFVHELRIEGEYVGGCEFFSE